LTKVLRQRALRGAAGGA